jgi:ribosomal protein L4
MLDKIENNELFFIEEKKVEKPSYKNALNVLKTMKLEGKKNLFVLPQDMINFVKSFNNINRNVAKVVGTASVKDIINSSHLIITESVYKHLLALGGEE